jgi:hypothetical protein
MSAARGEYNVYIGSDYQMSRIKVDVEIGPVERTTVGTAAGVAAGGAGGAAIASAANTSTSVRSAKVVVSVRYTKDQGLPLVRTGDVLLMRDGVSLPDMVQQILATHPVSMLQFALVGTTAGSVSAKSLLAPPAVYTFQRPSPEVAPLVSAPPAPSPGVGLNTHAPTLSPAAAAEAAVDGAATANMEAYAWSTGPTCLQSVDEQWRYRLSIYVAPLGITFRIGSAAAMAARVGPGCGISGDEGYILVVDAVNDEARSTPTVVRVGDIVLEINHQQHHNQNVWELEDQLDELHRNTMGLPIALYLLRPHLTLPPTPAPKGTLLISNWSIPYSSNGFARVNSSSAGSTPLTSGATESASTATSSGGQHVDTAQVNSAPSPPTPHPTPMKPTTLFTLASKVWLSDFVIDVPKPVDTTAANAGGSGGVASGGLDTNAGPAASSSTPATWSATTNASANASGDLLSAAPSPVPSLSPTSAPTFAPSSAPSSAPSAAPTAAYDGAAPAPHPLSAALQLTFRRIIAAVASSAVARAKASAKTHEPYLTPTFDELTRLRFEQLSSDELVAVALEQGM